MGNETELMLRLIDKVSDVESAITFLFLAVLIIIFFK